jgi:hypothetical protein
MSVKYLFHEDELFVFHLETCRVYRIHTGRPAEIHDPEIVARVRLRALEISPAEARARQRQALPGALAC